MTADTATPPENSSPRQLFHESLDRCRRDECFIPRFYQLFMESSDEIRLRFRNTDFEQQTTMLLRSLELSAAATDGEPEGLRELRERAQSHDRTHLNIRPELYDLWLDAILKTASEYDPAWNSAIEAAWKRILGFVIRHMAAQY